MRSDAFPGGNRNVVLGIVAAVVFVAAGVMYFSGGEAKSGVANIEPPEPGAAPAAAAPANGSNALPMTRQPGPGEAVDLNQPAEAAPSGKPAIKAKVNSGPALRPPKK